jgi:ADP-ribosylglycohydrolase
MISMEISSENSGAEMLQRNTEGLSPFKDRVRGSIWGPLVGDSLAMPVHWYYDRAALVRDYGHVRSFLAPRSVHPGSILWRSEYRALNERGEILHDQAQFWGKRGVHYHQFLRAGDNTLNLQLTHLLLDSLSECECYDADDYLRRYVEFMLTPGKHRDTYIEECHRNFFTTYARGKAPRKCAGTDIHIGGLAHVGAICGIFGGDPAKAREVVREHIALTHLGPEIFATSDALACILCSVLEGGNLRDAIFEYGSDWCSPRKAAQWSREPDDVVVGQRLSPACYLADAFPAALYLAWKYADDFESGVISNTNLGGDNCHRGAVVGALLGASVGFSRIPHRFIDGLQVQPKYGGG